MVLTYLFLCKDMGTLNLEQGNNSSLGPQVDCYNQGKILYKLIPISQKTYLLRFHTWVLKVISCQNQSLLGMGLIAAAAFIGPQVSIGDQVVIAARCY
jgi:putative colanic acid biosynthesis acetyltransferase WcaF